MSSEREQLKAGLIGWGYNPSEAQLSSMLEYLNILEITNASFNLTRIPRNEYVTLHLLDSLSCLLEITPQAGMEIIDVGTGAGFPGIPLAAMLPEIPFTLVDATAKKIRFVTETAKQCGILNVVGVHGRAEALARQPAYRGRFDVVVSRAVAAFPMLMEWLLPLTAPGGTVIAMKGSGYQSEIVDTQKLLSGFGAKIEKIRPVLLPGTDIERFLIVVRKATPTSPK